MGGSSTSHQAGPQSEVFNLISAAHAERAHASALHLLQAALAISERWRRESDDLEANLIVVQILSELAGEESTPAKRGDQWRRALHLVESAARKQNDAHLACAYGFLAVDSYQDVLSDLEFKTRVAALRAARVYVDVQLRHGPPEPVTAALLARKSSLLRQLAMIEVTAEQQLRLFGESFRCATKAVDLSKDPGTLLELGLSEWAMSAHEDSDEKYAVRLRSAEAHLNDDLLRHSEVAQLSLARLLRLTFRPLDACEQFRKVLANVGNFRRILRDSYIYAEAAIQLWYRTYPPETVSSHLVAARRLMEEALASGIKTGRHVVGLCQLGAILDGAEAGTTALEEIFTEEGHVSWEQALRLAARGTVADNIESGFVLGINDGSVWTNLGTFIYKFLQDEELAEHLYRYAVRLDPRDPVALTNLARLLVRKSDDAVSIQEARRLLQKAQSFADRRFTWWRTVNAELTAKEGSKALSQRRRTAPALPAQASHPKNLKEVTLRFKAVENLDDRSQRGLQLEQVVYDVARLTVGIAESSYRLLRVGGGIYQVDGYFRHGPDRYRVECKWEQHPLDPGKIDDFVPKLDAANVGGLVISMSGFSRPAVQAASEARMNRVVLLMDGDEARAVFEGRINFDEVISRKRAYFDQYSQPYHRVVPSAE